MEEKKYRATPENLTPEQLRKKLMEQVKSQNSEIIQEIAMPGVDTRIKPAEDR